MVVIQFILLSCSPGPSWYIRLAKGALADEDKYKAAFYFQRAYEVSLDDSFFLSSDDEFSDIQISHNKKTLVLIPKENNSFSYLDVENNDWDEIDVSSSTIKHFSVSPSGNYVVFVLQNDNGECYFEVVDLERDNSKFYEEKIDCANNTVISDNGIILYVKDAKIMFVRAFDSLAKSSPWLKSSFPPIYKNQEPYFRLHYSPNNIPFLVYGNAGHFYLYNIQKSRRRLLSKQVSSDHIFFKSNADTLWVITGGAGRYYLTQFSDQGRKISSKKVGLIKKLAFSKDSSYFFTDLYCVYHYNPIEKPVVKPLPFLAKNISFGHNTLYILSDTGVVMQYKGELPGDISLKIFDKAIRLKKD